MALVFSPISEISGAQETWTILAKVVRLWVVSDFSKHKIPFSIEMVLMDGEGTRIHASVRRTLVYKFVNELKEGCVYHLQFLGVAASVGEYRTCHQAYKLNFQFTTKVNPMDSGRVLGEGFQFVPIPDLTVVAGVNTDILVDVVGMLTGVGSERQYERNGTKTKLNVISLEADGHKIECTLFGPYVDELNTFIASGDVENAVVVVQFAKVKIFQEKVNLQNCMSCTKLVFNPTCQAAVDLKKRMSALMESPGQGLSQITETTKISMEEEFLELTPSNIIKGLKNCKQGSTFVVLANVKEPIRGTPWWYTACMCSKAVYADSNMYFCESCYKHVVKVAPRYLV